LGRSSAALEDCASRAGSAAEASTAMPVSFLLSDRRTTPETGLTSCVRLTQPILNCVILRAMVPRLKARIRWEVSRLVSAAEIEPQLRAAILVVTPVLWPVVARSVLRHAASSIVIPAASAAIRSFGDH